MCNLLHTIYLLACKMEDSSRNSLFVKKSTGTRICVSVKNEKDPFEKKDKNEKYHELMNVCICTCVCLNQS